MKQKGKRICSLLLIISLLIGSIPFVQAEKVEKEDGLIDAGTASKMFSFEKFPEVMADSSNASLMQNVIMRTDTDREPKNIIQYYMNDGTYEMQIFPIDVKYTDPEGIVRDKSNTIYTLKSLDTKLLSARGIGQEDLRIFKYGNKENDVLSCYPEKIENGIQVSYEKNRIELYPEEISADAAEAKLVSNAVCYTGVFGKNTDLIYQSTFNGIKEDIILRRNIGQYAFRFTVKTNGLILSDEPGGFFFIDGDGNRIAALGEIYIEDANHKTAYGEIQVEEIQKQEQYRITVIAPEDFLNAEDTSYPVRIDPNVTFVPKHSYGSDNIITSDMNSFDCTMGGTLSSDSSITLGMTGTSSTGIALVKFPRLFPILQDVASGLISASFSVYSMTAYTGSETNIEAMPITKNWSAGGTLSAANYSSLYNAYNSTVKATTKLRSGAGAGGYYSFSITSIVNLWKNGTYRSGTGVYGLRLSLANISSNITFHGATTATAAKMPRISIYYDDSKVNHIQDGIYFLSPYKSETAVAPLYLTRTSNFANVTAWKGNSKQSYPKSPSGYISNMHDLSQLFRIEYKGSGYVIQSLSTGQYLESIYGIPNLSDTDDAANFSTRWYFLNAGGKYYICNPYDYYLSVAASENASVTLKVSDDSDGSYWNLQLYCLDVEHLVQQTIATCGEACTRTILNYVGVDISNISETTVREKGMSLMENEDNSFGIEQIQAVLSFYTKMNGKELYKIRSGIVHDSAPYYSACQRNVREGYPVLSLILINQTTAPFNYTTGNIGHFIVIIGAYTDPVGALRLVVCDPHYNTNPKVGDNIKTPAFLDVEAGVIVDLLMADGMVRQIA